MKPQKMRRTLLLDIPRNVSRREHAIYTLQWGLVFIGVLAAAGTLLASMRGAAYRTIEALEGAASLTVADAAGRPGGAELVRIEGVLGGSTSASMPDDSKVEVLLGSLELIVKSTGGSDGPKEAVLYQWQYVPEQLWLVGSAAKVRLEVDHGLIPTGRIPRNSAPGVARPERISDGASPRLSRTVGYRYLDQDWPLPEEWGPVRSASARVERSYVEAGASFVVMGRLVPGEGGAALVVDSASGGGIYAGTLQGIRESSERVGTRLRFAWLPLLLGSIWLLLRVLRTRREFVRRSNE